MAAVDLDTLPKVNASSVCFFSWSDYWHNIASALSGLLARLTWDVDFGSGSVISGCAFKSAGIYSICQTFFF
jgi:hypothetical protein